MRLPAGRAVRVLTPATSANLGPWFDALGLALDLRDEVVVRITTEPGVRVEVSGECADTVPRGPDHLVVSSLLRGLAAYGVEAPAEDGPGLLVDCTNRIPHGRGLGSSAAAIVAGLVAARALAGSDEDDARLLEHANRIEGHPDNVAAALLGGLTVAWTVDGTASAVTLAPAQDLCVVAFVPAVPVSTAVARGLLPATVPHADAARNAGRAALMVVALTDRVDLLLAATDDLLHQGYRAPAMPESAALVASLREAGVPAVVSGAGPTVLVLADAETAARAAAEPRDGFATMPVAVSRSGATAEVLPGSPGDPSG